MNHVRTLLAADAAAGFCLALVAQMSTHLSICGLAGSSYRQTSAAGPSR